MFTSNYSTSPDLSRVLRTTTQGGDPELRSLMLEMLRRRMREQSRKPTRHPLAAAAGSPTMASEPELSRAEQARTVRANLGIGDDDMVPTYVNYGQHAQYTGTRRATAGEPGAVYSGMVQRSALPQSAGMIPGSSGGVMDNDDRDWNRKMDRNPDASANASGRIAGEAERYNERIRAEEEQARQAEAAREAERKKELRDAEDRRLRMEEEEQRRLLARRY